MCGWRETQDALRMHTEDAGKYVITACRGSREALQLVGIGNVVVIHEKEMPATCKACCIITCCGRTFIGLSLPTPAALTKKQQKLTAQSVNAGIAAAIIDHNELKVRIALRNHG